nr:DUF418 domain-containing protein [uncultured Lacibacter sp.]
MSQNATTAAPVSQGERIVLLDSLRGMALLGILLMNIPFFGLPEPAFENLVVMNELGTINQKVWYFINMVPEGTQRALFSMLFGAGILLFVSRLEKRVDGLLTAEYFIRRQLWLVVFGLFNAFILLWPGDILFQYGILGIVAFVFRRVPVKGLLIAAFVSLLLMTARENIGLYRKQVKFREGEVISKIDTAKTKLTDEQKEKLGAYTGLKEKSDTAALRKDMKKNLKKSLGSYKKVYEYLSNVSAMIEQNYTYYGLWDILLFMFIGMAFFKTGILTGNAPTRTYLLLTVVGLGIGFLLTYFRLQFMLDVKFSEFEQTKKQVVEYYEVARTFRSLGLFGLIMLLYKSGWFNWLFKLMQPVGQMAFTNYLTQSFICNLFFLGIGFGMMGKLQRYEIYYVVGAVWIIQIIWSHLWLKKFRFGPLEWCWRSLTYWKTQPIKKQVKENLLMEDDVPKE